MNFIPINKANNTSSIETIVKKAIIDKNARIGEVCRIGVDNFIREDSDFGDYYIKDKIIVIIDYGK